MAPCSIASATGCSSSVSQRYRGLPVCLAIQTNSEWHKYRRRPRDIWYSATYLLHDLHPNPRAGNKPTRKPLLLLRLSGWFLLRYVARQLVAGLFHEPPRCTRLVPSNGCSSLHLYILPFRVIACQHSSAPVGIISVSRMCKQCLYPGLKIILVQPTLTIAPG